MQSSTQRDLDELRHQEILVRVRFCNSLIQYTIAFASLAIAGLGGIFAAHDGLSNVNFELLVALFLLGSGVVLQVLNLLLAQEEQLIRRANQDVDVPVLLPAVLGDIKFFFITALAVGFPLFAWWYLADVRVEHWLLSGSLLALWVANLVLLLLVLLIRLICTAPRRWLQSLGRSIRKAQRREAHNEQK